MKNNHDIGPKPLLTPDEFWRAMGGTLGRAAIYGFLRSGRIRSIKVGTRFLIPRAELSEFPSREAHHDDR